LRDPCDPLDNGSGNTWRVEVPLRTRVKKQQSSPLTRVRCLRLCMRTLIDLSCRLPNVSFRRELRQAAAEPLPATAYLTQMSLPGFCRPGAMNIGIFGDSSQYQILVQMQQPLWKSWTRACQRRLCLALISLALLVIAPSG